MKRSSNRRAHQITTVAPRNKENTKPISARCSDEAGAGSIWTTTETPSEVVPEPVFVAIGLAPAELRGQLEQAPNHDTSAHNQADSGSRISLIGGDRGRDFRRQSSLSGTGGGGSDRQRGRDYGKGSRTSRTEFFNNVHFVSFVRDAGLHRLTQEHGLGAEITWKGAGRGTSEERQHSQL